MRETGISGCLIAIILAVLAFAWTCSSQPAYDSSNIQEEIGLNTSQVLRLRNYTAVDYFVTTEDGRILNVVVAGNPLVNNSAGLFNKQVVLFIHGTLFNATCFISDTPNASPRDYSSLNASQMSVADLAQLYNGSSNAESLVILLLDFGHIVVLLNKRGTLPSQGTVKGTGSQSSSGPLPDSSTAAEELVDSTSMIALATYFSQLARFFDSSEWNYSVDDQAKYDLPAVVDFILNLLGRSSLSAVGWSTGGTILEMGLSTQPELNQKIKQSLLWSPALYIGSTVRDQLFYRLTEPLTNAYIGPILPQFINDILDYLGTTSCTTELAQGTLCQAALDFIFGQGGNQELVKPGFFNSFPAPVSSHEIAQLGQASADGKTRMYSFGLFQNIARYGSLRPPLYQVSKITSTGLYFWGAANDGLVSIDDVQRNVNDLSVSSVFIKLDKPGEYFNHVSYLFGRNKSTELFFPCLKILES